MSGASFGWCLAGGFLALLCDIGITCLAALRSYTLFGLKGCGVKFSFLLTFSAEIVISQQDYYYRSAFILLDQAIPISHY